MIYLIALVAVIVTLNLVGDREAISMDAKNRMLRPVSVGLNDGRWFIRTDWWVRGWRWTFA